ncbi:MAG TPA: hypothetical protein VL356_09230 [Acidocella sp.]|nr:hypothetical protein [Acidocella sp.]
MSRSLCGGAALVALSSVAFLLGCSSGHPGATQASNDPASGRPVYSLNTPLSHIAADKRGKAILQRDLPGLMASRSYPLFDSMSLSQIAVMSGGRLTQSKLNLVKADLAQLSDSGATQ